MTEFLIENWAAVVIAILMIVGAVIDGVLLKVPNWLTFPMILTGWLYWIIVAILGGNYWLIAHTLGGTFLAGGLVLLPYVAGMMGAGDVKLYAAYGGWIVPFAWFGYVNLLWAFAWSVILGGIMGAAIMMASGTLLVGIENIKESIRDNAELGYEEKMRKAKERKAHQQLLPYGIPLTIGSLLYTAYVIYVFVQDQALH